MATEKTCFKCGQVKSLSDFYRHPRMADGHLGKCKECARDDVSRHRDENIDRIREYDRMRGGLPNRLAKNAERSVEWRKSNPDRRAAQMSVQYAIRSGKLSPLPCWVCNKKAEAHHPDYSQPLDVVWLCRIHHAQVHAQARKF